MYYPFIQSINSDLRKLLNESDEFRNRVNSIPSNSTIEQYVLSFVKTHLDIIATDLLILSDILFESENLDSEQGIIDLLNQMSLDNESPIE